MRYAERYGGNSAAAFAMFDAELARRALRPNRIVTDGTALPSSFDDVRIRHYESTAETDLNPDIAATNREYGKQVAHFNTSVPGPAGEATPSGIRGHVHARGTEIRKHAGSARAEFDAKAEIINTPDGTLASKRSLLKQSSKQIAEDGAATLDSAKDAVKDLLKRH